MYGLQASVGELNTLVGIRTNEKVQGQIDSKADSADLGTIAQQDANNVSITGGNVSSTNYTDGNISNSTITNSTVTIPAGATTTTMKVGATLQVNATPVGNVGGGEDTLITYPMLASNALKSERGYLFPRS